MDILITGSEGLIGSALATALTKRGDRIVTMDLRGRDPLDVRNVSHVRRSIASCRGVIQLAAISRVAWAEQDPALCEETNVGGTQALVAEALACPARPWVLFASSREVYGQPSELPATEETPLRPMNVYGRSKVAGERLLEEARSAGLRTAIVRLSNVYGRTSDHADRVVPAFARAAVTGETLRVDGGDHAFDFTHIDDVVDGLLRVVDLLDSREAPPPIQLVSGEPTSLRSLASLVLELASSSASTMEAPPRAFDISRFYGDATRARSLLGWHPRVSLRAGLSRFVADVRQQIATN